MASEAFTPETNTSLARGEHPFTEFSMASGVSVSLDGDVDILVDGTIQIDGALQGDCTAVELRGGGGPGGTAQAVAGAAQEPCGRGYIANATDGNGGDRDGIGYGIVEPADLAWAQDFALNLDCKPAQGE